MPTATLSPNGTNGTVAHSTIVKGEIRGVEIPQIRIERMQLVLVGDSPLISHKWSEKAKRQMLDKQTKQPKQGKEAKDPIQDFIDSLYVLSGNPQPDPDNEGHILNVASCSFGFPCVGFKAAAVSACRFADGMKMTEARGAFHVVGEFATIEGDPTMREDMCRIGMGTADIRFRGEFKSWRTTLNIDFNPSVLSVAEIGNLFNLAGFGVGVGEWRPEKDGSYGRFHVQRSDD